MNIVIKNEQVRKIFNYWVEVWKYEENDLNLRFKAYTIIQVIKALVAIYEGNIELDEEEIEDLFIDWEKSDARPLLPEEIEKIKEIIKEMRGIENAERKK